MAKFAKNVDPKAVAHTQAANIMKALQGEHLRSVGTIRNYEQALGHVALYANAQLNTGLRDLTPAQAHQYLIDRSLDVGQKTLDMERQALQAMMQHVTKQLPQNTTLDIVRSEHQQHLQSRAYTPEQVKLIIEAQNDKNGLSTALAYAAGLRAHELFTLQRNEERNASPRPAHETKFSLRDGVTYTVHGKGGLIREIQIPPALAERLEAQRLDTPKLIIDRQVHYTSHYDLAGGKNFSSSFSKASVRVLGWSGGAHGLRHSYAQERMNELQSIMVRSQALEVVSQEMGHFRPEITEVYLR